MISLIILFKGVGAISVHAYSSLTDLNCVGDLIVGVDGLVVGVGGFSASSVLSML